ncbi:conserved hypothetical protein, partial [Ricinus communis]
MNGKRPGRLALGFVDEVAIAAPEEDQRRGGLAARRVTDDANHEDHVIAAVVACEWRAFEMSQGARYQRGLGVADRRLDLIPLVRQGARELIGDLLLIAGEDVDGEALGFEHRGQALGLAVDAEQDQRRIERNGIERAHGHTDELFAVAPRGHHRNAGREFSQHSPECA